MRAKRPSRRRFWFRLCAAALLPLACVAALELGLRLAGFGYDTALFKKIRIGDRDYFVNNDDFVRRFFPPEMTRLPPAMRMEAEKPEGTCRIFVLGESAALGDPSPPYGAGRYLQALLEERYPRRKFEVVNTAITAINSHAILPIARECARHQGDFWIIYMGNNEMVGPYGAATVFGVQAPPRWVVRLSLGLQKLRLGQLFMAASRRIKRGKEGGSWGGMEMFAGNHVPPGDPRKEQVYRNFEANLRDTLNAGVDSGARVILNTVAVNLKDSPPFASASNDASHVAIDEFHRGEALWQSHATEAREEFQRACDDDALPFRADSRINSIIGEESKAFERRGVVFCDAANPVSLGEPSNAIAGEELFYEHVHFNFDGNYRLARAWADSMDKFLTDSARPWASQAACEARLALTDWNRALAWTDVLRRRRQPPLDLLENNASQSRELSARVRSVSAAMNAASARAARGIYLDAIARAPEDYELRFNYGDFLDSIGDAAEAIAQWRAVQALLPSYYLGYFQEGRVLERSGQLTEAADCYRRTIALYPRMTTAWFELSNIHASLGDDAQAMIECRRACQLEPGQPAFRICLGRLLVNTHRRAEALEQYRLSIQIQPDYMEGYIALGEELLSEGASGPAATNFQEAVRLQPGSARAHADLGQAFEQLGRHEDARLEYQRVLQIDPGNAAARDFFSRPPAF